MKKIIAAAVGVAFAVASLGSFAAGNDSAQVKTHRVAVHAKHKVKHAKLHHVKAKKHSVRHAKKLHRTA